MKRSTRILLIMVVCAIIALGFGFYVMNQRVQAPVISKSQDADNSQTETQQSDRTTSVPDAPNIVSTSDWKLYENDKHGFSIRYPADQKAGTISDNSVLGTVQAPVRGFHVGPLVLVVLKDPSLKKDAQDYFDGMYNVITNPPAGTNELPPVECRIQKVTNPNVVSIRSVVCNGEGGSAKYAYIEGKDYDVFVDGYSKGYDNSSNGDYTSEADYLTVLSTFSFRVGSDNITTTDNATDEKTGFQSFSISADDGGANPSEITVKKDSIVELTFNVGSNVYYGGLEFRSPVVNSGVISANNTKTISFKASESFAFTPYWPSSSVSKNYKINVLVQ